jgi:hypothetical protein
MLNIFPITFVDCGDLQKAIDTCYDHIANKIQAFDEYAEDFLSQQTTFDLTDDEADCLLYNIRANFVGNYFWRQVPSLQIEEASDCKTASRRRDTWMEKLIMAKEDLRLRCEGTLSLHKFRQIRKKLL